VTAADTPFSTSLALVGTTYVTDGTFKLTTALTVGEGSVVQLSPGAVLDMSTAATATKLLNARARKART
jgi:hypothetical protein